MTLQQVIITTDNVDVGTVDNQENVEPDNRKDPARFYFICHFILVTLTPTTRMTDLELKRRNRRESNQIQKTQEGMVSFIITSQCQQQTQIQQIFFKLLFFGPIP